MKTLIICGKLITLNFIKDITIENRGGLLCGEFVINVRYVDNEKVSLVKIPYFSEFYFSLNIDLDPNKSIFEKAKEFIEQNPPT